VVQLSPSPERGSTGRDSRRRGGSTGSVYVEGPTGRGRPHSRGSTSPVLGGPSAPRVNWPTGSPRRPGSTGRHLRSPRGSTGRGIGGPKTSTGLTKHRSGVNWSTSALGPSSPTPGGGTGRGQLAEISYGPLNHKAHRGSTGRPPSGAPQTSTPRFATGFGRGDLLPSLYVPPLGPPRCPGSSPSRELIGRRRPGLVGRTDHVRLTLSSS
jgi:hypothetical protein